MKVVLRVRPFTPQESSQVEDEDTQIIQLSGKVEHVNKLLVCRGNTVAYTRKDTKLVASRLQRQSFTYDKVLDQSTDQRDAFEATTLLLVPKLLEGYNATIFAYGATGCGKSYTMFGEESGIVNQTIALLLKVEEPGFSISMSYFEVYNEKLYDLLSTNITPKPVNNTEVDKYVSLRLHSEAHFIQLLHLGAARRKVSATVSNRNSSRSHAALKFILKLPGGKQATLTFVDLAGSERPSKNTDGSQFNEGTQINQSLLALGVCINALAQRKKFVPYRNSLLTRVLQPSLSGGSSLVLMIACVSPNNSHGLETLNTLNYAKTARTIPGSPKPAPPPPSTKHQLTQELASYERKCSELTKKNRLLESQRVCNEARIIALDAAIELVGTIYAQRIQCWYEAGILVNSKIKSLNLAPDYQDYVKDKVRSMVETVQSRTSPQSKRKKWCHSPYTKKTRWSVNLEEVREFSCL